MNQLKCFKYIFQCFCYWLLAFFKVNFSVNTFIFIITCLYISFQRCLNFGIIKVAKTLKNTKYLNKQQKCKTENFSKAGQALHIWTFIIKLLYILKLFMKANFWKEFSAMSHFYFTHTWGVMTRKQSWTNKI